MPQRPATSRPRHAGFTFVELLVAMAIIAIVLPVTMAGLSVATQLADNARHRTRAAALADSQLNQLIATGDWQTSQLSGNFPDFPSYTWKADVTNWSATSLGSSAPAMYQIDLTVSWTARNQSHTLTESTLVSDADANTTTGVNTP